MSDNLVPLAYAVQALREQLQSAISDSDSSTLKFKLSEIELEFATVLDLEGKAGAEAKFKILGWGAKVDVSGTLSDSKTQRVKLKLIPHIVTNEGPKDVDINRRQKTQ